MNKVEKTYKNLPDKYVIADTVPWTGTTILHVTYYGRVARKLSLWRGYQPPYPAQPSAKQEMYLKIMTGLEEAFVTFYKLRKPCVMSYLQYYLDKRANNIALATQLPVFHMVPSTAIGSGIGGVLGASGGAWLDRHLKKKRGDDFRSNYSTLGGVLGASLGGLTGASIGFKAGRANPEAELELAEDIMLGTRKDAATRGLLRGSVVGGVKGAVIGSAPIGMGLGGVLGGAAAYGQRRLAEALGYQAAFDPLTKESSYYDAGSHISYEQRSGNFPVVSTSLGAIAGGLMGGITSYRDSRSTPALSRQEIRLRLAKSALTGAAVGGLAGAIVGPLGRTEDSFRMGVGDIRRPREYRKAVKKTIIA